MFMINGYSESTQERRHVSLLTGAADVLSKILMCSLPFFPPELFSDGISCGLDEACWEEYAARLENGTVNGKHAVVSALIYIRFQSR